MDDLLTRRQLVGAGATGAALLALDATPAAARRTRRADVCVVGAGLSGLAAARALVAADRTVVVLEARDRVGGRTWNRSLGGGRIAEVGGEFVGPTQDRILALARAVGVKTFDTYNTGSNVLIAGGARSLYDAVPGLPTDPDVQQAIVAGLKLDAPAKQAGVSAPWKAKQAHTWDAMTLDDYARAEIPSEKGRATFTSACQARSPVDYFEQDWTKERWTRGCPVAHAAPGVLTKYGPWLRRAAGRVHFAGTETADYWLGYMDGAVRAGERAARDVQAALRR